MRIKRTAMYAWLTGLAVILLLPAVGDCFQKQSDHVHGDHVHKGEMGFPEFADVEIKGAPKLGRPFLVMGSTKPVLTEKHGLAGPALWDWDGDGKQDLLVGEFETGDDESNIRVYLNIGTKSEPEFKDEFEYAKDTKGNVITVRQW